MIARNWTKIIFVLINIGIDCLEYGFYVGYHKCVWRTTSDIQSLIPIALTICKSFSFRSHIIENATITL